MCKLGTARYCSVSAIIGSCTAQLAPPICFDVFHGTEAPLNGCCGQRHDQDEIYDEKEVGELLSSIIIHKKVLPDILLKTLPFYASCLFQVTFISVYHISKVLNDSVDMVTCTGGQLLLFSRPLPLIHKP